MAEEEGFGVAGTGAEQGGHDDFGNAESADRWGENRAHDEEGTRKEDFQNAGVFRAKGRGGAEVHEAGGEVYAKSEDEGEQQGAPVRAVGGGGDGEFVNFSSDFFRHGDRGREDLDDAGLEQEQKDHGDKTGEGEEYGTQQGEVDVEESQAQGQGHEDEGKEGDEAGEFFHGDDGGAFDHLAGVAGRLDESESIEAEGAGHEEADGAPPEPALGEIPEWDMDPLGAEEDAPACDSAQDATELDAGGEGKPDGRGSGIDLFNGLPDGLWTEVVIGFHA
jgi:hypothetical protein